MMLVLAGSSFERGRLVLAGHGFNLDYSSPVKIHHFPRFLKYDRDSAKIALRQDALLPNAAKIDFPSFQKIKTYFPRFKKTKTRPRYLRMQMPEARQS